MEMGEQEVDLKQYLRMIYRRRILVLVTAMCLITAGMTVSYLLPKSYEASSTVLIQRNIINELIRDITSTPSVQDRLKALSVVLMSRSHLLKVLADLDIAVGRMPENKVEGMIKMFQSSTKIRIEASSSGGYRNEMDLFVVSFKHPDPGFARDYVNALIKRYIVENRTTTREAAMGANRFIYEQLDMYKEKIDRVTVELAKRRGENETTLVDRLAELQTKLDAMMVQYTNDHPEVIRLRSDIESARQQLAIKQAGSRQFSGSKAGRSYRSGERSLDADEGAFDPETSASQSGSNRTTARARTGKGSLKTEDKSTSDLERERDAYRLIYDDLARRMGRAEVSAQVEGQDKAATFRIIDPAVLPTVPAGPGRLKLMLMSIIGGILGGAGLAILLDLLDKTIKSLDALKGAGFSIIGVIPHIQSAQAILAVRRRDMVLYSLSGFYLVIVASLVSIELMGAFK